MTHPRSWPRAGALALGLLLACGGQGPRPLVVGEDACEYCRMAITDTRFGGEIVLTTGRHRTFDSIECLASYLASGSDSAQVAGVWVSDYESRSLVDAATAVYLRGGALRSPMGMEVSAFSPGTDPGALARKYGGSTMTWREVRSAMQQAPGAPGPSGEHRPVPGTAPPPGGRP